MVIGGGALLLRKLIARPTLDLDAVALVERDRWVPAISLPGSLVNAIREVAVALDLPHEPRDEKDWLNGGPSFLLEMGLPPGFERRTRRMRFGGLTLHVAGRRDLITLKLWSATGGANRGARREVDIADLGAMNPTKDELRGALRWCEEKDGREGFRERDAAPVLRSLGVESWDLGDA